MKPRAESTSKTWVILLLLALSPSARAGNPCLLSQLKAHLPPQYEFVDPAANPKNLQGEGYPLGGGLGGTVAIVEDPLHPGQAVVKKTGHGGRFGGSLLANEAALLHDLQSMVDDGVNIGFQLPKIRPFKEVDSAGNTRSGFYSEYKAGRNARDLLLDPRIPDLTKRQIRARYRASLELLKEALSHQSGVHKRAIRIEEHPSSAAHGEDGLPTLSTFFNGKPLLIKGDNVIVNPFDLSLSLIDPF